MTAAGAAAGSLGPGLRGGWLHRAALGAALLCHWAAGGGDGSGSVAQDAPTPLGFSQASLADRGAAGALLDSVLPSAPTTPVQAPLLVLAGTLLPCLVACAHLAGSVAEAAATGWQQTRYRHRVGGRCCSQLCSCFGITTAVNAMGRAVASHSGRSLVVWALCFVGLCHAGAQLQSPGVNEGTEPPQRALEAAMAIGQVPVVWLAALGLGQASYALAALTARQRRQ